MRAFLLGLLALATSAAAAQDPIPISIPDEVVYSEPSDIAGTGINVPVLVGADVTGRGIISATIIVGFDPGVVSFTSFESGSLYPGCSASGFPSQTPGEFNVSVACGSSTPFRGGPGPLLTLSGTLTGSGAGSTVLTLVDTTPFSRRQGTQEVNVPVAITNGRVTVVTDPDPTVGAVDGQTTAEDTETTVELTLSDQDTPLEAVTVTPQSSSPALVASGGLAVGLCEGQEASSSCRVLRIVLVPDAFGTATITLTASDGTTRGQDTSTSFELVVTPVNDAPTVLAEVTDQAAPAGSEDLRIDLTGVFDDIDDTALTYAVTSSQSETANVAVDGSTAVVSPVRVGTATLTLRATDAEGLSVENTFVLTVTAGVATEPSAPASFALHGSAPNPASTLAHVLVDLPSASDVQVQVYDIVGRRVLDASAGVLAAGARRVPLELGTLPAGLYVYRVTAQAGSAIESAAGQVVVVR